MNIDILNKLFDKKYRLERINQFTSGHNIYVNKECIGIVYYFDTHFNLILMLRINIMPHLLTEKHDIAYDDPDCQAKIN